MTQAFIEYANQAEKGMVALRLFSNEERMNDSEERDSYRDNNKANSSGWNA